MYLLDKWLHVLIQERKRYKLVCKVLGSVSSQDCRMELPRVGIVNISIIRRTIVKIMEDNVSLVSISRSKTAILVS